MVDLNDYQENPLIKALTDQTEILQEIADNGDNPPTPEGLALEATQLLVKDAVLALTKPNDTQKISAVDLPLPNGATTESTLSAAKDGILALTKPTDEQTAVLKTAVSSLNSSSNVLNAAASFIGTPEDVLKYSSIVVACKTDQDGTLTVEFSTNGTNWDSQINYNVNASLNEVHRLAVTRRYVRVSFTNTSASNQTYFRLQTILGNQTSLTRPLNLRIQSDTDSQVVTPVDFNLMVAEGLYQNRIATVKDGLNLNIGNGNVTQDITNEGGAYAGFPTAAVQAGEIVVAGADTGTIYYSYLASATDTEYTFGSKAIAGAGTYSLGHNVWRSNFAYFISTNVAVFNVGTITMRNTVTAANVFWRIDVGFSQTYCAAYTVPFGSAVYVDRFNGNMRGSATGSLNGYIWYRPSGESPRLRFPFELQFGTLYFDDVDYLIKIPAQVDFVPRITVSSANGLAAKFSFRLLKVKT